MRRLPPRILALAGVLVALVGWGGAASGAQAAATYGLSDSRAAMFDAPEFTGLDLHYGRLVLPWNAASVRGPWDAWLDRAHALGVPVMISLNIDRASSCTGGTCTAPSVGAYRAELDALLARYPNIDSVSPWNEPNHVMQPTRNAPAIAAAYFDAAFDACAARGGCVAVAGNILDAPALPNYFVPYRAALKRSPAVWGIHSYYDTTYYSDEGLQYLKSKVAPPIWITETGGLMRFAPTGGGGLYREPQEAATSLEWLFTMVELTPRVQRVYLYDLWEQPSNQFDSSLLWADGTHRPAYVAVADYLGPRRTPIGGRPTSPPVGGSAGAGGGSDANAGGSAGAGSGGAAGAGTGIVRARVVGKRVSVRRGQPIVVRVRCLAQSRCALKVKLRIGGWRVARKLTVASGKTARLRVPITSARYRKLRALGRPTHTVTICPAKGAATCTAPVRLARATG